MEGALVRKRRVFTRTTGKLAIASGDATNARAGIKNNLLYWSTIN